MDDGQLRSRLAHTFRKVFGDNDIVINDAMTADDFEQWDSLTYIDLIVAIEREFRIKITTNDITKFEDVGNLITLIQTKVSGGSTSRVTS